MSVSRPAHSQRSYSTPPRMMHGCVRCMKMWSAANCNDGVTRMSESAKTTTSTVIVRQAAVAGSFYPADPDELRELVDGQLEYGRRRLADLEDTLEEPLPAGAPKAVIVPHAGYVYSGTTAALAYALLERGKGTITRAVIMGPTHRVPVRGVAMPTATMFATPLGRMRVDTAFERSAADLLLINDDTHEREHAVEVQLPFIQRTLGDIDIVPLNASEATPHQVGDVLRALWGGPETVVIISSDLSHYHPELAAQAIDDETIGYIAHRMMPIHPNRACGAFPIGGLLDVCVGRGLDVHLLGCSTSGEDGQVTLPTPDGEPGGGRPDVDPAQRVVGYASFAVWDDGASPDDSVAAPDAAAVTTETAAPDAAAQGAVADGDADDDGDASAIAADDAAAAQDGAASEDDRDDGDAVGDSVDGDADDEAAAVADFITQAADDMLAEAEAEESGAASGGVDLDADSSDIDVSAGEVLIDLARLAVEERLGLLGEDDPTPDEVISEHDWLREPGASFVTLTEGGTLRGCIGSLRAHQPLGVDVAQHAVDAALHDPRFAPVDVEDYDALYFEVSVLGEPEPMDVRSRSELEAALEPGVDGLIIDDGAGHSATFLPQVWEQLGKPSDFVSHLLAKAGLPSGFTWNNGEISCSRYHVTAFAEEPEDEEEA